MQEPTQAWRQCPTRPDGGEVLIEHRISGSTCQARQRKTYHKCFSCVHQSGALVQGTAALPPREALPERELVPAPPQTAPESAPKREPATAKTSVGKAAGKRQAG